MTGDGLAVFRGDALLEPDDGVARRVRRDRVRGRAHALVRLRRTRIGLARLPLLQRM